MESESLLRRAVEILGSQKALAVVCDTSQPHVAKWLRTDRLPRTAYTGERDYAARIEAATGIPRDELLARHRPERAA